MSAPAPAITVVVPTFRRPGGVRRLVGALAAQDLEPERWEAIVVDDASGEDTAAALDDVVARSECNIRAVHLDRNGGPARARNEGTLLAAAPVVAFIDDDCVPEPGWLRAMLGAFERNPELGVVQGLVRRPDGGAGPWTLFREITWETPWFEGCNIAYRRDVLLRAGGFDEEIRWYGEDTSLGWKVVEGGAERDFEPGAAVTHDLEERGLGWRIRHGWLEQNLVELALRHPGLRRSAFWRPWAFRPSDAAAALAVVGALAARRRRPSLLLVLPYLVVRRLPWRRPRVAAGLVAIDAAQLAGHLAGSLRRRTVVL